MKHQKGATMNQLLAWEYEGKTEFGYEISRGFEGIRRFVRVDNPHGRGLLRGERLITNLRKVKVVDEDAIVLTGITKAELIWFTCGLNATGSVNHAALPHQFQFERIKERILKRLYITPPITEPKNFGATVEAKLSLHQTPRRLIRSPFKGDTGIWYDEDGNDYVWAELIDPTIIPKGVE